MAISIVHDADDAEDVLADSFARSWSRRHQCRSAESFGGWVVSVVRSVALNHLKSVNRRRTVALEGDRIEGSADATGVAERSELRRMLLNGMARLTELQRQVLMMSDYDGLRHAAIAEALGISEVMSRRSLSDARSRMRQYLTERGVNA